MNDAATVPFEKSLIFHDNGHSSLPSINKGHVFWKRIQKHQDSTQPPNFKRPKELDILVCHNYPKLSVAEKSLQQIGIHDVVRLGEGISKKDWRNFFKFTLALDYLENKSTAEYVLHVDAGDVLVTESPEKILDCFLTNFDCDALFNCEKISSPGSHMCPGSKVPNALLNTPKKRLDEVMKFYNQFNLTSEDTANLHRIEEFERSKSSTPFCHLNTGCYIGKRKYLIELLKEAISIEGFIPTAPFHTDDQILMRELYRSHYPNLQVDTESRIFQCMFLANRDEIRCGFQLGGFQEEIMHTIHQLKPYRHSFRNIRYALGLTREQWNNRQAKRAA